MTLKYTRQIFAKQNCNGINVPTVNQFNSSTFGSSCLFYFHRVIVCSCLVLVVRYLFINIRILKMVFGTGRLSCKWINVWTKHIFPKHDACKHLEHRNRYLVTTNGWFKIMYWWVCEKPNANNTIQYVQCSWSCRLKYNNLSM